MHEIPLGVRKQKERKKRSRIQIGMRERHSERKISQFNPEFLFFTSFQTFVDRDIYNTFMQRE